MVLEAIERGFVAFSSKKVEVAPAIHLGPFDETGKQLDAACVKSGFIKGSPETNKYFVIKVASGGFKANLDHGLPTGDGVMVVFSK
jgi:ornithine cyclodeaminase/alanine dehydrogenase-like protein (mu-crystallin family)